MSLPDTEAAELVAGNGYGAAAMSGDRRDAARAFGQTLRAARLERGISQEQLAEASELDRTYPSLLERGLRTPTFFVIVRLAEGLNTDPVALFRDAVARLHR
jgi:ribosome-binding protein aMBF1 (putative translation factor)